MKRARTEKGSVATSAATTKKPKTQACASCRKQKTRCELLDTSSDPVQCHRCKVIGIHCSYEETLVPSAANGIPMEEPPIVCTWSRWRRPKPKPAPAPPPKDRLWDFVSQDRSQADWSAPMLMMHHLTNTTQSDEARISLKSPLPLDAILSTAQTDQLLTIFSEKLSPWLNFKLMRQANSALLDAICCAVALRFVKDIPAFTQSQLLALIEASILEIISGSRRSASIEAVQVLLISSLWEPFSLQPNASGSERRDCRVLIASAVSMAMNMRLNQASAKANKLHKARQMSGGKLSAGDFAVLEEASEQARLWISIVNAESMLCIGTGRIPLSRRSADDNIFVQLPESFSGIINYGDMRLGIVAMQSSVAEKGVSSRIDSSREADDWYDTIFNILENLKRGRRFLLPLPVVLDHQQSYFHALHIYDGICRLLVLYHGFWEARTSVGHIPVGDSWHDHFRPRGINVVADWGRDMIQTSEAVLVYVLQTDVETLRTLPDNYFVMVVLAAGYIIGVKFLVDSPSGGCGRLLGASDLLLKKATRHLESIAPEGEDHVARRCATVLDRMMLQSENRLPVGQNTSNANQDDYTLAASSSSFSVEDLQYPPNDAFSDPVLPSDMEFGLFLETALSLDARLWNDLQESQGLSSGYLDK
ncbi:hypothetical protein MIND_00133800 [Mycena indigotica]|uniref:Zn(2)-C6 fungal-type domain-containing protein n=1 Tax=Mycena indigotica TaxID=2126181 RepID=A0A8H6WGR4_9AGAR|nr:uncharacterized protein MIND_00133800 [Mycena indigotica]KAF7316156.1 hypothetical protein MIND_00133800 [Mycena indigotica]